MRNLSSASKAATLCVGAAFLTFAGAVLSLVSAPAWMVAGLDLASVAAIGSAMLCAWDVGRKLDRAAQVCVAAADGDLKARIVEACEPGLVGELQRNINRALDVSASASARRTVP